MEANIAFVSPHPQLSHNHTHALFKSIVIQIHWPIITNQKGILSLRTTISAPKYKYIQKLHSIRVVVERTLEKEREKEKEIYITPIILLIIY